MADNVQCQSTNQYTTVVLTGFGPFSNHYVNASWEAVKLVPNETLEAKLNAKIVIENIPVVYETVSEIVPSLWDIYNPILVIHVGVSSIANCITLESCARNVGYTKIDIHNHRPAGGICCSDGPSKITCPFDLDRIAKEVQNKTGLNVCKSVDAGKYLCEFTYYLSLNKNPASTLFVHVPILDRKHTAKKLADALRVILQESLVEARKLNVQK